MTPNSSNPFQSIESVGGAKPRTEKDLRKVLEDKQIDGVIVATPDHWHSPAAILALDAGKHVYVEKPCGHNLREDDSSPRPPDENRIVQVGTQSRSSPTIIKAMQSSAQGAIGDILE